MRGRSLVMLDGGQGTGRTPRLMAAMREAAGAGGGRRMVLVDPATCWTAADVAALGEGATIMRGELAASVDVFDVLALMARAAPGLVVGFDDAEHASDDRRRWSSLAAVMAQTGGRLFVMMPDLGLWTPEGPPGTAKDAGSMRRTAGVRSFRGGSAMATLASAG